MEYPNSGALFKARLPKRHPKAPDWAGDLSIDKSILKELIEQAEGTSIKIKLSAWEREGKLGKFFSLKYDDFKPRAKEDPLPF